MDFKADINSCIETKEPLFERLFCDPCRIKTCNLLIRSQILYSIELRDHYCLIALAKLQHFSHLSIHF